MSILCLTVPLKVAEVLFGLPVPGKKTHPESYHVTLSYLPKLPIGEVARLMEVTAAYLEKQRPFDTIMDEVGTFPKDSAIPQEIAGEKGIPIIVKFQTPYLISFQNGLEKALLEAGFEFSKDYPEFIPHLTLSYSSSQKDRNFSLNFPPVSAEHTQVSFWGGSRLGGIMFKLPIGKKLSSAFNGTGAQSCQESKSNNSSLEKITAGASSLKI